MAHSKYELVALLAARASELAAGELPLLPLPLPENMCDPLTIAEHEWSAGLLHHSKSNILDPRGQSHGAEDSHIQIQKSRSAVSGESH
tara:strand:+ start:151 stop:414 length:264 start_codon:yes stop_codon:yes gene_type:complete